MFLTNVLLFTIIFVLLFTHFHRRDTDISEFVLCIGFSFILTFIISGVFYFVFYLFN